MTPEVWVPYCGSAPAPGDWRWNLDPILLAGLAVALLLVVWRTRGVGRLAGLAAIGVLFISFVSPLCALSSALFSARTVHHVLLVAIAAPLSARALPAFSARKAQLGLATAVQAVVLWAWHAPSLYGAALANDGVYWLMQGSLFVSAVWFWAGVRSAPAPTSVAALLAAMIAMGLLGALLTFAGQPLYGPHLLTTGPWGMTPLEDQQAAGLIMWAPAAAVYLAAALVRLGGSIGPDRPVVRVAAGTESSV
jgi:putative membrane protein